MTTENTAATLPQKTSRNSFLLLLENLFTMAIFILIASGIIALTTTWRSSKIEFIDNDELRITESSWWGLSNKTETFLHTSEGWLIERSNGDKVAISKQPRVIHH